MGETKLVGVLNTEVNRRKSIDAKGDEKAMYESRAVYAELDANLRKVTFREVLEAMVKNSTEPVALEARDYLQQHNGVNTTCEVRAYNADSTRKRKDNTEILGLDEKVAAYIDRRKTPEGTDYDCLDMTVKLYDDVGICI
ncbi:MAG: hypothetical protein KJ955_07095 [Nanoarchaeota archaeon]|nr:hypothetical protein [Nanoarchaeota archaeon]